MKGKQFPFSLFSSVNEGKNQSRSPCSSNTSSLFPVLRSLSHVTPPWTLVKQCHVYLFLLISDTTSLPHPQPDHLASDSPHPITIHFSLSTFSRGYATPFSCYMPKADIFQKLLWLCTYIMTCPECFFFLLHIVWGHAVLNVIFSESSSLSQEHIQRKLVYHRWCQKKS